MKRINKLQAPFPWFGGKRRVAPVVWQRFGDVRNYVEPFFGSGAVLLGRPEPFVGTETVNDKDGFISNFWRAIKADPEQVACWADWPQNENDQHARHFWLKQRREELRARLEGDPDYYDAKIAGWWVWAICLWIGSGFCETDGPWVVENGKLVCLGSNRQGINRQCIHLSNRGLGINRQCIHLGDRGRGIHNRIGRREAIVEWFTALSERLRDVRVCSGDWTRVLGPSPTTKLGMTAVFLDPPYSSERRDARIYTEEDTTVAHAVRDWAVAHGGDPLLRIALCGYEGEHDMPDSWECYTWKAGNSYGNSKGSNPEKERIWFSPCCIKPDQGQLVLFE